MTEKWKPKICEQYWFIDRDGDVRYHLWTEWDSDNDKYDFGNCFRTQEEAKAAAEKVKALLLSLHEQEDVNSQKTPIFESLQQEDCKKRAFIRPSHTRALQAGPPTNRRHQVHRQSRTQSWREPGQRPAQGDGVSADGTGGRRMNHEEAAKRIIKRDVLLDPAEEIFLVWQCKTLQNWKGIFSVTGQDKLLPLLYEIMYNGDKDEYYADRYVKTENKVYKPAELFWTKWTNENTAEEKNLSEQEWVIPGEF